LYCLAHILVGIVKTAAPIHTIDLHYLGIPAAIAAYLIDSGDGPILIETGPASTLEALRAGVANLGLQLTDIHHALVTHIHLDHAGAAGHLAQHGTQIYVHEFGAKHLIDPSRLIDSATRIYGDQMDRLWGQMIAVPAERITPVHDEDVIEIGRLRLRAIETPGHARHHHAFALDDVCFAGDIAGITLPASLVPEPPLGQYIAIPTPPPEFDLQAWNSSIDRLMSMNFTAIYPTHYGVRRNVRAHLERTRAMVLETAEFVRIRMDAGHDRDRILREYIEWNRAMTAAEHVSERDFARYASTNLLTMNVDGVMRYWQKQQAAHAAR
jgi:glyoxylase-like metal-dependent hydrolase (beta-lactamase superfamily II)